MADDIFGIVGSTQAAVFRVERVVAEGGFAVVYRAHHAGFRAPVALKCLKVPDAMTEEQRAAFLEKFREEGELLFRLSALAPTIVRPLHVDVLVLQDLRIVPFLALEWLEGESLDRMVETRRAQGRPPIDVRRLVPFLQPAAHALALAHHMPGPYGPVAVIHRDLKPENFFVSRAEGGEVIKILDFGIARTRSAAQLDAGAVTSSAAVDAFTPGYAAPEQWMPRRYGQAGPWTDVFGLALTMVEVLTGRTPLMEDTDDLGLIAERTMDTARRPTPRARGAVVPDEVERAFAEALAVDPRARTQSIEAFWTALEVGLGLPSSFTTAGPRAPTRSLTSTSDPPPPPTLLSLPPSPSAPTQPAPLVAPSVRPVATSSVRPVSAPSMRPAPSSVRRPDESPLESADLPEPPPIPFELAAVPTASPSRPASARPPPDLDLATPPPPPRSAGTRIGPPAPAPPAPHGIEALRGHLQVPLGLFLLGVAVTLGDWIYLHAAGEPLLLAGIRPMWTAGPLALLGVMLAVRRILAAA